MPGFLDWEVGGLRETKFSKDTLNRFKKSRPVIQPLGKEASGKSAERALLNFAQLVEEEFRDG